MAPILRESLYGESPLLGDSAVMRRVRERIARLALLPWPARVEGQRGSGKRIACRMIYELSSRALGPYIRCSMHFVPNNLELAKLVGNVKGAFTGAHRDSRGAFEVAHGGVIALDEIGDATPVVQGILLQFVEEGTFIRIGEVVERRVDVRVITATNADLDAMARAGTFRADLLDRLGKPGVRLPALAEHVEDIPQLVGYYLPRKARQAGLAVRDLTPGELDLLMAYSWPGNVRQIKNVIERVIALTPGRQQIEVTDLPEEIQQATEQVAELVPTLPGNGLDLDRYLTGIEYELIRQSLSRTKGNKRQAAQLLGLKRTTLIEKLRRLERSTAMH